MLLLVNLVILSARHILSHIYLNLKIIVARFSIFQRMIYVWKSTGVFLKIWDRQKKKKKKDLYKAYMRHFIFYIIYLRLNKKKKREKKLIIRTLGIPTYLACNVCRKWITVKNDSQNNVPAMKLLSWEPDTSIENYKISRRFSKKKNLFIWSNAEK